MRRAAKFSHERRLWNKHIKYIAGIDEVGRGSWAGPVVASAVVFPPFYKPKFELFDSKLLSPPQREVLAEKISQAANIGIGVVGVPTINKIGIGRSSQRAFKRAIRSLSVECGYYLIDAFYIRNWSRRNQLPLKKGDKICASIAAASIVAKVYRDNLMKELSTDYPQYRFHANKGYGTLFHRQAIRQHKLSAIHRTSFNLSPYLIG